MLLLWLTCTVYDVEARNHASADSVQWQRKGVPLHIVQSQGPMERTLTDIVALAKVLYQEEQKAFHAAMAESADRSGHNLTQHCSHQHGHIAPNVQHSAGDSKLFPAIVCHDTIASSHCCINAFQGQGPDADATHKIHVV